MKDQQMIVEIECFNCGERNRIPFRLGVQQASYTYCYACGEGIAIESTGDGLLIYRLSPASDR